MKHPTTTVPALAGAVSLAIAVAAWPAGAHAAFSLSRTFDDPTVTGSDQFGASVALQGNSVLVGAPSDNTMGPIVGQAHLFDATTGALLKTFDDPTATGFDHFGNSVALDGNNVLIGARQDNTKGPGVGQAHLFDATTGTLLRTFDNPTITSFDNFGQSVAIDGTTVLVGDPGDDTNGANVGQAHLFNATTGALLRTFDDPTPTSVGPGVGDQFGTSVTLQGNTVLIGAPADDTKGTDVGQAHLFNATTGALLKTFDDPTITSFDTFGQSVAIDGTTVLVGDPGDDTKGTNVGQAHLFNATTGTLLRTFDNPTPAAGDLFGFSVALDGNNVLIGAFGDDTKGNEVGQAYLFDATTGALLQTFDDPTVGPFFADQFGRSVALQGNNVLIGAQGHGISTLGADVGQAHLFTQAAAAAVPEPSTLALMLAGLAGLALAMRRRT